jgi:hypothetical protein
MLMVIVESRQGRKSLRVTRVSFGPTVMVREYPILFLVNPRTSLAPAASRAGDDSAVS